MKARWERERRIGIQIDVDLGTDIDEVHLAVRVEVHDGTVDQVGSRFASRQGKVHEFVNHGTSINEIHGSIRRRRTKTVALLILAVSGHVAPFGGPEAAVRNTLLHPS